MQDESQNIENGLEAPVYKEEMGGMSVYISRKKGLFGEDGTVNGTVNDTVEDSGENVDNKHNRTKNDTVNDTANDTVNDTVKLTKMERRILQVLNMDYTATYASIMDLLQVARPTVARAISKFQKKGLIVREGSDKSGYWYITEKGKQLIKKQK